ncbi:double-stranded RNA-binding protein 2-like [Impatiens glandulifera]|uniref:double-stranded RNA-binding protein 2-like n=1 Tax=Impatiens glandulifera TaxID=253017 RepID=UPI001FB0C9F0|nr:double-stranded RNA-binding protein 2-like [Impatiens glandulifera]
MYKNQLQELAQRSCFNLPSYTCIREGPDHAPRFKATVNFNRETFESPNYCTTLRQAEHAAAEVALSSLSSHGPSHSLAARILDETGVYKNLLQEIAQRVGSPLPQYTTFRFGLGHLPVFTGVVELAGITFTGEPAKNKKQAEKNAALAAWTSLKQLAQEGDAAASRSSSSSDADNTTTTDELEQVRIARALFNHLLKAKISTSSNAPPVPFEKKFQILNPPRRPSSPQNTSKILPFFSQKTTISRTRPKTPPSMIETGPILPQKFPTAPHYVPFQYSRTPHCSSRIAPPVTVRSAVPVYSAQPFPIRMPPPVCIRQAVCSSSPLLPKVNNNNSNNTPVVVLSSSAATSQGTGNNKSNKNDHPLSMQLPRAEVASGPSSPPFPNGDLSTIKELPRVEGEVSAVKSLEQLKI